MATYQAGSAFIDVVPSFRNFHRQIRSELATELRDLEVKIPVEADTSDARREIAAIRAELQALTDATVGVDLDSAEAQSRIELLQARLRELDGATANVDVDADTAAASAKISAVDREVDRLDGRRAEVKVDVDRDGDAARTSMFLSNQISTLVLVGAAIAPAFVPAFAAAGAAALGFASTVAAASIGVGGLLVSVLPAITNVTQAVKAQEAAEKSAATSSASTSRQRIQASFAAAAAAQAVTDAQRASDRTAQDGARQVTRARRDVADAYQRAGDTIVQADQRATAAELALVRAQQDQIRAQLDLTEARQEALRTLEDMRERTTDLALSQESAEIALIEAQQRKTAIDASASATAMDRRKAALAVAEAENRLADIRRDQGRASTDLVDAEKKGVDSADQVVSAQERLARAGEAVASATRQNQQAQVEQARAQVEAARIVSDAEEQLAETRQQAAQANADAARSVSRALQSQAQQAELASLETAQGTAATQNLAYAMAQLSPMQRLLMTGWLGLRDAFNEWALDLEPDTIPVLLSGISLLERALPILSPIVRSTASAFGDLLDRASKALEAPFWQKFFDFLGEMAGPSTTQLGRILGNMARGFAGLLMAFGPFARQFGGGLVNLTDRFADWAETLDKSNGFRGFISYVQKSWPQLKATLAALWAAISNVVDALAPLAGPVLVALEAAFGFIADIPPGQLAAIAAGILSVASGFKAVGLAARVLDMLSNNPILLIVATLITLGVWLVHTWQTSERFRDTVLGVWNAVKNAAVATFDAVIGAVRTAFDWVKDNWPLILAILTGPIGLAVLAIVKNWDDIKAGLKAAWDFIDKWVIQPFVDGFDWILDKAGDLYDGVVGIFKDIGGAVSGAFSGALDGLKKGINWVIGVINDHFIDGLNVIVGVIPGLDNIPDIPLIKMHTGGIVPGTGETPRMLLGGEAVLNQAATQMIGPEVINALNKGEGFGGPFDGFSWDTFKTVLGVAVDNSRGKPLADALEKGLAWTIQHTLEPAKDKVLDLIPEKPMIPQGAARGSIDWAYKALFGWAEDKDTERPVVNIGLGHGKDGMVFPLLPLSYRVGVGFNGYPGHTGQDFPAGIGTPVFAPFAGKMSKRDLGNRSYGKHQTIKSGPMTSIQAHLSAFAGVDRSVLPGELVGFVGSTGNSTGPHLHQEFRENGSAFDPRQVLVFDRGGNLPTGLSLTYNGTGQRERVLDPAQTRAYETGRRPGVANHFYGTEPDMINKVIFATEARYQGSTPAGL